MTASIIQNVIPRHRAKRGLLRPRLLQNNFQRGNVNHATVTVAAGVLALVTVGLLGFFYLRQVVGTASQGSDIHEIEQQLSELREHQRELELEGAQLRSLQTVEERIKQLELVEAEHVTYLASETDDRVALNNL